MAKLLFKLNNVPEDEAEEVRQLLTEKGFATYETSGGFFGLGVAAIWLNDKQQFAEAKRAIDVYQENRAKVMRAEYERRVASGEEPTFWQHAMMRPFQWLGVILVIGFILAVIMLPFWKTLHP